MIQYNFLKLRLGVAFASASLRLNSNVPDDDEQAEKYANACTITEFSQDMTVYLKKRKKD